MFISIESAVDSLDCLGALRLRSRESVDDGAVYLAPPLELRGVCAIQSSGFWMGGPMATYWPTEQRKLSRATRGLRRHRDRSIPCDGWADATRVRFVRHDVGPAAISGHRLLRCDYESRSPVWACSAASPRRIALQLLSCGRAASRQDQTVFDGGRGDKCGSRRACEQKQNTQCRSGVGADAKGREPRVRCYVRPAH